MKFESLSLCEPLLRSLQAAGYVEATPIQQKAIPPVLEGRDLVGCAQTGTGKTAAFSLPLIQRLMNGTAPEMTGAVRRRQRSGRRVIRALILAPTRELAGQIHDSLANYGRFSGLRQTVIFGGVGQGPQVRQLQAGVDTLVATPGRLLDLIGQGFVDLANVEYLVLDEADQMLDMGFIHDLRKIVAQVPVNRQTLMFSATMPKEIRDLARKWLRRPVEVQATPVASTPELVAQSVYFVEKNKKPAALTQLLVSAERSKTLVFSRTKRGADKIAHGLQRDGIRAIAIHGDKSQTKRQAVIREFGSQHPPVLVATDLAARGLDFSGVSHVINYDLPETPETYIHRIGRTARAGASGQAISLCGSDERHRLRMIEKLTGQSVVVERLAGTPKHQADAVESESQATEPQKSGRGAAFHAGPNRARAAKGRLGKQRSRTGSGHGGGSYAASAASRGGNGQGARRRRKNRPAATAR